jgi:hypothetical protein
LIDHRKQRMPEIQWWYAHGGEQLGPVSPADLRQLAANGSLAPTDLVWREGMPQWAPAGRVKGLFPETVAEPAPAESPDEIPTDDSTEVSDSPFPNFVSADLPVTTTPVEPQEPLRTAPEPRRAPSVPAATTDRPRDGRSRLAVVLLCLQGMLWGICVMVILLGSILFAMARSKAQTPTDEAAAAVVLAMYFIGSYVAARAGEKLSHLLQRYMESRRG